MAIDSSDMDREDLDTRNMDEADLRDREDTTMLDEDEEGDSGNA